MGPSSKGQVTITKPAGLGRLQQRAAPATHCSAATLASFEDRVADAMT
jgi:hypothetical protein